jgi:hypothetical protein
MILFAILKICLINCHYLDLLLFRNCLRNSYERKDLQLKNDDYLLYKITFGSSLSRLQDTIDFSLCKKIS